MFDPCEGCIHSKEEGCVNVDRVVALIKHAKDHIEQERYFTAAQILMAAGSMKMDFDRDGFTKKTRQRSPSCLSYVSADEDFNKEAGTL